MLINVFKSSCHGAAICRLNRTRGGKGIVTTQGNNVVRYGCTQVCVRVDGGPTSDINVIQAQLVITVGQVNSTIGIGP